MAKKINIAEEARSIGVNPQVIYNRMNKGMTLGQALSAGGNYAKLEKELIEADEARDQAVKALIETENEVDALEGKLEFAATRCKIVSAIAAVIIAILAWVAFGNGSFI